jgi:hypothetical protein
MNVQPFKIQVSLLLGQPFCYRRFGRVIHHDMYCFKKNLLAMGYQTPHLQLHSCKWWGVRFALRYLENLYCSKILQIRLAVAIICSHFLTKVILRYVICLLQELLVYASGSSDTCVVYTLVDYNGFTPIFVILCTLFQRNMAMAITIRNHMEVSIYDGISHSGDHQHIYNE